MDVLLLKNIKKLGEIGSKVSVKSGYARNYLLPTNQAVLPTKANLAKVEEQKQELLKIEEEMRSKALLEQEKFNNYELSFEVNIQEEDKLFGSVTLQNVVDRLKEDGLTEKELNKFKKKYLNDLKYYFKNNDFLINRFGNYLYYDRDFTIAKYTKLINDINIKKLKIIFNLLFDYNKMSFISYGNYSNINYTKNKVLKIIKTHRKKFNVN